MYQSKLHRVWRGASELFRANEEFISKVCGLGMGVAMCCGAIFWMAYAPEVPRLSEYAERQYGPAMRQQGLTQFSFCPGIAQPSIRVTEASGDRTTNICESHACFGDLDPDDFEALRCFDVSAGRDGELLVKAKVDASKNTLGEVRALFDRVMVTGLRTYAQVRARQDAVSASWKADAQTQSPSPLEPRLSKGSSPSQEH